MAKVSKGGKGNSAGDAPDRIPAPSIDLARELSRDEHQDLVATLKARFEKNMSRHHGIEWAQVEKKLLARPEKLRSLNAMEQTGGEPDIVGRDDQTGEFIFFDCSPESPKGRRSTTYDREGQEAREKEGIYPAGSALGMAEDMGIELLTEDQYRALQERGQFDLKTSSWVKTPTSIRKLGGGLFCDRRYGQVFTYHNGAPSFYAARGFRGALRV
jgi:hypothetical protein